MILSQEPPAIPDALDSLLPPWAQGLSLLTLLVLIVAAFLRDWVISSRRNQREVDAERRISDIHEANFNRAMELNEKLTAAFQPVLDSNEAVLKAVTEVQEEQRRMRENRRPR